MKIPNNPLTTTFFILILGISTSYLNSMEQADTQQPPLNAATTAQAAQEEDICGICIDPLNSNEPHEAPTTLPCKHHYHKFCIDTWFASQTGANKTSCPECRTITSSYTAHDVTVPYHSLTDLSGKGITTSTDILKHLERNNINPAMITALDLSHNLFTTLPSHAFAAFPNLRHLKLTDNIIKSIEPNAFFGLHSLRKLDLNSNSITSLKANTFDGLCILADLNLQANHINTIETNAFANLPNLVQLNLDRNTITTVQPDAFAGLCDLQDVLLDPTVSDEIYAEIERQLPHLPQ